MAKIILKGYIIVPDVDLSAVKGELNNHITLTLEESGCLVFNILQSNMAVNRFDVYEEFSDMAAFDAHQARVRESIWGQLTVNVERHYEISRYPE